MRRRLAGALLTAGVLLLLAAFCMDASEAAWRRRITGAFDPAYAQNDLPWVRQVIIFFA